MDITLAGFLAECGRFSGVIVCLVIGLKVAHGLWRKEVESRDARDKEDRKERGEREAASAKKCDETQRDLVDRLRKVEDEMRNEGRQDRAKLLEVVHRSTRAFEILSEKLPILPPSGQYPAQGG